MATRKLLATGTGQFPLLMLVVEKCWPHHGDDATSMSRSWVGGSDERDKSLEGFWAGRRHVFLETVEASVQDPEYWRGYGWEVREATDADFEEARRERRLEWDAIP